ncbi:MerR family transcriptional regulator [Actinoplanes bogorensis]|uniref:MerR family transcriptional regulator n=1 Tax=Paractinoplanes bogorensis TaxID=1610840 RepID=A0ABS5YP95_9ACTN|nr:MerR family transcriptional regulator [Actinoplanes bogorensis]MBU2665278.1 MerR family transcriptional regulator [Actinoplanes bogorensis]
MAWSTQQLADLAGTTVKAVRHYHRIGLLEEPVRTSNGYKQYQATHLVRLLQIKRVSDLGVPLAGIDAAIRAEKPRETIEALDAELAATVERLQRIRAELAVLLEHDAPLDVPAVFGPVAGDLTERDRALVTVYSQVLDDDQLDDLRTLVADPDESLAGFEALTDDADDATIDQVVGQLVVAMRRHAEQFPWMADITAASARGKEFTEAVVVPAVIEYYSQAQLTALARAHAIMTAE